MRIVGLTGGIGSGKSTVAHMLAARGASVIDADRLARAAVEKGSKGLAAIVDRFGAEFLTEDGQLDRRKLGRQIFEDAEARAALNGIVHPEVASLMADETEAAIEAGAELVVYDVPLLFENKLEALYRPIIVVSVSPEVQWARIKTRDLLTDEEIRARIAAQLPLDEKARQADHVIDNDGDLAETERQVEALFNALTGRKP